MISKTALTETVSNSSVQSSNGQSVLILSGVRGDTRRYRTFHPYEQLRLLGINSILTHITDPNLERQAQDSGIVIIHRAPYDRRVETIISEVKNRGGSVLLDADDLTFWPDAFQWIDSPDFHDPIRADLYREDMRRNQKTFELCQGMTASTQYLADLARGMGKPAWVCRNAFSLQMLALSEDAVTRRRFDPHKVVIGYASGTPTHNRDFAMVAGAVQTMLRDHPECELWIIGPLQLDNGWRQYDQQVRHLDWVPWRELPELLGQFDINLAPLVSDNPFSQSKSEIKYVEAGLVRVPTIASPTNAFQYAIKPGVNGFLANKPEEWMAVLDALILDASLRREMGERAYQDVLARFHPQVRAHQLLEVLTQANEEFTGRKAEWLISRQEAVMSPEITSFSRWENHPTMVEMGMYNLRQRGVVTLLRQMWIYFRRLIAPIIPYR